MGLNTCGHGPVKIMDETLFLFPIQFSRIFVYFCRKQDAVMKRVILLLFCSVVMAVAVTAQVEKTGRGVTFVVDEDF